MANPILNAIFNSSPQMNSIYQIINAYKNGNNPVALLNQLAKQYSIDFNKFNEYDFNFVMNMIYSDYYGAIPNEIGSYVKIAMKFLNDKDYNDCKAFNYYYSLLK